MEQPSSGSANPDNKHPGPKADPHDAYRDHKDSGNQRMVADRLLAALASGNLDHLAQAREAFLKESPPSRKPAASVPARETTAPVRRERIAKEPPVDNSDFAVPTDLEARLERRAAPRTSESLFAPVDELREVEEEIKQAEAELERRRNEVQAAKRRAEEDAKRRAFEQAKRQLEIENQRRAQEE